MTREDALEIIRKNMPSDKSLPVYEALQTLIPELAESEDEKVRKWLLDYAIEMIAGLESDISLSNYDGIKGHDPEAEAELAQWQKARAWLEKQKDLDKMIVVSPEVWDNAISDAYENGKKDGEKQKEPGYKHEDYFCERCQANAFNAGRESVLKEQKPVEKQDYSDLTDLERAILRGFLAAGVENVPVGIIKETAQECLARMKPAEINELEIIKKHITEDSLSSEVNKQLKECGWYVIEKPTECIDFNNEFNNQVSHLLVSVLNGEHEYNKSFVKYAAQSLLGYAKNEIKSTKWGEEDEIYLQDALWCVKQAAKVSRDENDMGACWSAERWLKSLRPQPKQKVNNVITPNKEFFQWIYNRLVDVHKENPNVDYMISFKKRIEELSFDRPSWKPSEEQMEALQNAVALTACDKELVRLYNQLKKL